MVRNLRKAVVSCQCVVFVKEARRVGLYIETQNWRQLLPTWALCRHHHVAMDSTSQRYMAFLPSRPALMLRAAR